MTLDEDLAGLDEAFKMRLANLEGYITCQQTNKAFENADSSWYFRRNSPQNEVKTQDKAQMFDTKYQKTAVSIMEQAKEKFLVAFKSINYKQGTAIYQSDFKEKNHFLLIEVENSFDGKVIWEDGGIVPMTTKQSDLPDILMEHGIGLKNVKNVADHYLGDMDIKIKNDVFKVTVMLQQKEIK